MRAGPCSRDRGDGLGCFEAVVAAFEVGLVAVGGEDLGGGQVVVVGDQRPASVRGGAPSGPLALPLVDGSGDACLQPTVGLDGPTHPKGERPWTTQVKAGSCSRR